MAKILLVDDSRVDRLVVRKMMKASPHQVVELENPENIWETILREEPDLILLDIVMPGQNGYALCRELKRNPATANIPIIFLSSRSQKSDIFWGRFLGANDYLTKPCRPQELLQTIERWIDNQKQVSLDGY